MFRRLTKEFRDAYKSKMLCYNIIETAQMTRLPVTAAKNPPFRCRIGRLKAAFIILTGLLFYPQAAFAAERPGVIATIRPLHSIAAAMMAGTGAAPALLIAGNASPHDYRLKPSDHRRLATAGLIVRIGGEADGFIRPRTGQAVLVLADLPGIVRLRRRQAGLWDGKTAGAAAPDEPFDPHLWLDPRNMMLLADALYQQLSALDPAHGAIYRRNRDRVQASLVSLDSDLRRLLAPVSQAPYILFHDAFQYLERAYDLHPLGALRDVEATPPSPRRLSALYRAAGKSGSQCIFTEPQFGEDAVQGIARRLGLRIGTLDPLGTPPDDGSAYARMMRANALAISACLNNE